MLVSTLGTHTKIRNPVGPITIYPCVFRSKDVARLWCLPAVYPLLILVEPKSLPSWQSGADKVINQSIYMLSIWR